MLFVNEKNLPGITGKIQEQGNVISLSVARRPAMGNDYNPSSATITQNIGISTRTTIIDAISLFRRETARNGQHSNSHTRLQK